MILGIYGAGGLGREVLELAKLINTKNHRWNDFIFVIDGESGAKVNGITVYHYQEAIEKFSGNLEISMGIGEPSTREKLFAKLKRDVIPTPTLIHPDVFIPETTVIGQGVTIQYGCFISCNVTIGNYAYIQPQVNIGHDDKIGEGAMLSGMVNLGGNVSIGKFTYLGLSAAVREGVNIGDYSIIGMYSAVHKDIESEMIAMGNPARPMRKNEEKHVFK